MSAVRFIQNPNTLLRKVQAAGGKKVSEAVADAEAAVEMMSPNALLVLDEAISDIARSLAGPGPASPQALEDIYRRSGEIHGVAGAFGLPDLGEAAWSLCELIDTGGSLRNGEAAILAHLDSLRLLRLGDAVGPKERRAVLDGLRDLRLHAKEAGAG